MSDVLNMLVSVDWFALVTGITTAIYAVSHLVAAFGRKELADDLEVKAEGIEKFKNALFVNYGAHANAAHTYRKVEGEKPEDLTKE